MAQYMGHRRVHGRDRVFDPPANPARRQIEISQRRVARVTAEPDYEPDIATLRDSPEHSGFGAIVLTVHQGRVVNWIALKSAASAPDTEFEADRSTGSIAISFRRGQ